MFRFACAVALAALSFSSQADASLAGWSNDAGTGVLLMRGGPQQPVTPATLLTTDVDIRVSGPVARVTVRQSFFNQGSGFAEAVYVFPLPETAAIHGMEMVVGQRRIVGEIHEKARAKAIYEQAKRAGRRAGLVEQRRPNVFTTAVANVAAGDRVEVTIEYTQKLVMDDGRFSVRFPLTLTPRFRPAPGNGNYHPLDLPPAETRPGSEDEPEIGHPAAGTGSGDVSGPVAMPGRLSRHANRAGIEVTLDAGFPLARLESTSHAVTTARTGAGHRVTLRDGRVPMDRDFLLSWEPAVAGGSRSAFFTETVSGEHYGLLMVTPPKVQSVNDLPREVVFIIDRSGSMGGASIRQARASLLDALGRLGPSDRFNIIAFDSDVTRLFGRTVPADRKHLARARGFVSRVQAGGGTRMLPALEAGLTLPGGPEYLRQVVFITDGAVTNENAIFALLHQRLDRARLFTVGIGSAPNTYFMRKAAEFGRGSFTYVSGAAQVRERMSALFRKLESPVMRDIRISLPEGVTAEMWPERVPDLYAGEPLLVSMKLNRRPAHVTVSGRRPAHWEQVVSVPGTGGHAGIATLWAREKITALMDRITRGEAEETVRPRVVSVALTHALVSRYTSFVAVDQTPARPTASPLHAQAVPNHGPAGFAYPGTALGLNALWLRGLLCLLAAALLALLHGRLRHA